MKKIILDISYHEIRAALIENGRLTELITEPFKNENIVGNIYLGRVENVLPGMKAAFLNIGLEKNAYFAYDENNKPKIGTDLIVMGVKPETDIKGAVVTDKISFTGKNIVILPNENTIGISKKIEDKEERERLKNDVSEVLDENFGIIVRTQAKDIKKDDLLKEILNLQALAKDIVSKGNFKKSPCVLYKESSLCSRIFRELFTKDIDEFIINDKDTFNEILNLSEEYGIAKEKVILYEGDIPVFQNYMIESQVEKAYHKKIWLKSGGFIIIEQTEALVSIDVNTGKFSGNKDKEKTFLKTNIEAAKEIAYQLRLKNLSGIIIVDFIDMVSENDREELKKVLTEELKKDRIKTVVVGMTELGLMQITRKKTRPSIWQQNYTTCKCCEGEGVVPSFLSSVRKLRREVLTIFSQTVFKGIKISADRALLNGFAGENGKYVKTICEKYDKTIELCEINTVKYGYYEIEKF